MIINFLHFLGSSIVVYVAAKYFVRNPQQLFPFFSILFGIVATLSLLAVFFLPTTGQQYYQWEEVYRWRGITSNPNSLGIICMMTVWANTAAFMNAATMKVRILNIFFIVVAVFCLIGAESRTSQILSVLSVIIMILVNSISKDTNTGKAKKLMLLAYFLVIATVAIMIFFSDALVPEKATDAMGRDTNLSGRTYVWEDAMTMIKIHPLTGWGFDNHKAAFSYLENPFGHYHNGYLDVTVKGGLIGLVLFMALLVRIFRDIFKAVKVDARTFGPFIALVVAFLIFNITEVAIGAFANILWQTVILSYLLAGLTLKRVRRHRRKNAFVAPPKKHRKKLASRHV